MSIHMDRARCKALRLHNVESISLGPVESFDHGTKRAFVTRKLTVSMLGGESATINLFADDADALAIGEAVEEAIE